MKGRKVGMLPSLHIWMAMDGSVSSEIDVCVCVCVCSLACDDDWLPYRFKRGQARRQGGREGRKGRMGGTEGGMQCQMDRKELMELLRDTGNGQANHALWSAYFTKRGDGVVICTACRVPVQFHELSARGLKGNRKPGRLSFALIAIGLISLTALVSSVYRTSYQKVPKQTLRSPQQADISIPRSTNIFQPFDCADIDLNWSSSVVREMCITTITKMPTFDSAITIESVYSMKVPYTVCNSGSHGQGLCATGSLPKGTLLFTEKIVRDKNNSHIDCDSGDGFSFRIRDFDAFRRLLSVLMKPAYQCRLVMWAYNDLGDSNRKSDVHASISVTSLVNHGHYPTIREVDANQNHCSNRNVSRSSCLSAKYFAATNLIEGDEYMENYCNEYRDDRKWLVQLKKNMGLLRKTARSGKSDCI